jgi:hypothetical protein
MTYPPQPPPGSWQPADDPNPSSGAPQQPTTPIPGAAYPMPPTQPFAAPDPQQPPANPYAYPYGPQQPPAPYGPPRPYPATGPAPKSNRTLIAVIVGAAVLLVAGLVTSAVLFIDNASGDRSLSQPSAAATSAAAPLQTPAASPATSPVASPAASPAEESADTGADVKKVVYEVTGKGKSTITYTTTIQAEVKQLEDQKLPWKFEFDAGQDAALLVSGMADFSGGSDVTCRILVDGKEVAKQKGAFAMCSSLDY